MLQALQVLLVQNPLGPLHQRVGLGLGDALAHQVARWAEAAFDLPQGHIGRVEFPALLDSCFWRPLSIQISSTKVM